MPSLLIHANIMAYSNLNAIVTLLLIYSVLKVNSQISTACTSSVISSFTPCFNYLTGSSNGGTPSAECCDSLKTLLTDQVDCTCLIITGNVPVSLPFNRTLAISLPRVCKSGVPIQCKGSGVPLPAPGPVLFGPTPAPAASAPHRALSPRASKATALAPPPVETTDVTPPLASPPKFSLAPTANPGIRPVFNPNSAANPAGVPLLSSFMLVFVGIMVLDLF